MDDDNETVYKGMPSLSGGHLSNARMLCLATTKPYEHLQHVHHDRFSTSHSSGPSDQRTDKV